MQPLFKDRSFRLCYWNADARVVDVSRMGLEQHLAKVGDVKIDGIKSLDDLSSAPCDLLIVAAQAIRASDFAVWLQGLKSRLQRQGQIWLPALVLSDVPFETLRDILPDAARNNWYFDIMAPDQISSLPIRVANLLRIHDHLHELKRYAAAVEDVSAKVQTLENEVAALRAGKVPS